MDDFFLKGARQRLVSVLRTKGISDENVLNAFAKVERHRFLESFLWQRAYDDVALPLHCGQTISQPFTVAFQTQLLEIQKNDTVLEIGTGSGFQAAILNAMDVKVYTLERQMDLFVKTKEILSKLAPQIVMFCGDGFRGLPDYAPYDKIIVTCGAPSVPPLLLKQLKVGGKMVIPVGEGAQVMTRIVKLNDNEFKEERYGNFVFVPMLEDVKRTPYKL